jgi:hypothetical protein
VGALGPIEAVGLDALREGCAAAGVSVSEDRQPALKGTA